MVALTPVPRLLPARQSLLRFVHDRNPFYLLSALSMFIGFRVVLGAMNARPGDWYKLLLLIGVLNVYEVAIIALGLFLIVRRGLRRDGWFLLAIEALFLVDLTNLNAELFTANPRVGSLVNGLCFALAMVKVLVVVRTLKLRLTPGTTLYIAAQLAFLLGLPGLFWLLRSPTAYVSPMQIYGVWWLLAGLVVAGGLLVRPATSDRSPMAALPWRLYVLVPLVSLVVHLASQNRVYWVHLHLANVTPLVLASVVVMNLSRLRRRPEILQWSFGLIALAVLLSITPYPYQHELTARWLGHAVTPLRVACLASAGTMLFLAIRQRSPLVAALLTGSVIVGALGSNLFAIRDAALRCLRWIATTATHLIPETDMQWGFVAITGAFVLLALGALVSLHNGAPPATGPVHEAV